MDIAALLTLQAAAGTTDVSSITEIKEKLTANGLKEPETETVVRHIARLYPAQKLLGNDDVDYLLVESCVSAARLLERGCDASLREAERRLAAAPDASPFLVGDRYTIADLLLWSALDAAPCKQMLAHGSFPCLTRFCKALRASAAFANVFALQNGAKSDAPPSKAAPPKKGQSKADEGKFITLDGAEKGKVVVRFPPEASGYLHIGHAKAALLNQYYRDLYEGQLIMRFDDTNPAKESSEFEKIILEDLDMLEVKPDRWTHTSDHFDALLGYCAKLLRDGRAYVDDTPAEQMKKERELRVESSCRNQTVERNLELWQLMQQGAEHGLRCCVRVKLDMQSNNGCMRDPTIYRCKPEPHVRTGNKYRVYPTYDFACPIVDSVEGVTHALRTTEYHDRDEQYFAILEQLGLRKPFIWEYCRLAMTNTLMSKRKLTCIVDEGVVHGWDDPRMPTIRGVRRRGLTVQGLKQFIVAQGSSRSVVMMEWDKIWAFNKKAIDPVAPRYAALLSAHLVRVHLRNVSEATSLDVALHPKDASIGSRPLVYGQHLLVEHEDAISMKSGDIVTFVNLGNVRILHGLADGRSEIEAETDLDNKDFKKTAKVTWLPASDSVPADQSPVPVICTHYEPIISKAVLQKDEDWKQYVNADSEHHAQLLGEACLARLHKGDIVQILRKGFYICDRPFAEKSAYSGATEPLVLLHVPDGHTKELPTGVKKAASPARPVAVEPSSPTKPSESVRDERTLLAEISEIGSKIRKLKEAKAAKDEINPFVQQLLASKKEFKAVSGREWSADLSKSLAEPPAEVNDAAPKMDGAELKERVDAQADTVRQLKQDGAAKARIDEAVFQLLDLKKQYRDVTGVDLAAATPPKPSKAKGAKSKAAPAKAAQQNGARSKQMDVETKAAGDGAAKKQTRLGMEARKADDFAEWYGQVITKGELIEYYDVSGCYVLRPNAFAVWEHVQGWFDAQIKKLGVDNCYFPMFVSAAALEREKEHIADFAPEVAWVTKSGQSEMAEPVAIRPTSETVMYPSYAKWVQSHRDLPIKLNQWCNVVRWEFKHPTPFLRTREFLWQEGHTAYATKAEAVDEVHTILDLYAQVYTDLLAVPVIKGRKTDKEKFAGGEFTTTVEAYIPANGRGVQGATSHHLGQNFSKMFEIVFEDPETQQKQYAFQNSWGLSTRSIGAMVMIHGDDNGLVMPPRVAKVQVVVIPCGVTAQLSDDDERRLLEECRRVTDSLRDVGLRAQLDDRDNYSPGWKFNHWELKGVPVRVELGPKDLAKSQCVAVRRDTAAKTAVALSDLKSALPKLLDAVHDHLYEKAKKARDEHLTVTESWDELKKQLEEKCIIQAPFCGDGDCEDVIKKDTARVDGPEQLMGAKTLCIPFEQPRAVQPSTKCIHPKCGRDAKFYTLFGRSY